MPLIPNVRIILKGQSNIRKVHYLRNYNLRSLFDIELSDLEITFFLENVGILKQKIYLL